jgi:hypothetical protein
VCWYHCSYRHTSVQELQWQRPKKKRQVNGEWRKL